MKMENVFILPFPLFISKFKSLEIKPCPPGLFSFI